MKTHQAQIIAFPSSAPPRTVIDHRLTAKQRDEVTAILAGFAVELGTVRRDFQASAINDLASLVVTVRDVEQVAAGLDRMGAAAANEARTAFYAAALRLRQFVEV